MPVCPDSQRLKAVRVPAGLSFSASSKSLYPGAYFACFEATNATTYTIEEIKAGEAAVVRGARDRVYISSGYEIPFLDLGQYLNV